jgi:hypothetical protein
MFIPKRLLKGFKITILPLFLSSLSATILLLLLRESTLYDKLIDDSGAWATFFTVYGVLYAIIVGFLMLEALSKYNNLSELIDEEVNDLQDIRDFTFYLQCPGHIKEKILSELGEYAYSVATKEWQQMKTSQSTDRDPDTTKEFYEILLAINNMEIANKFDEIALKILLNKIAEITTDRTKRLSIAHQRLPLQMKFLLYLMSVILIVGLILVGVHHLSIHIIMVVSLVMSVHLLNILIFDLDNPFKGLWQLTPQLFIEFQEGLNINKNI